MDSDTGRHQVLLRLDERQLAALDVLGAGGSHATAAEAAGVDRVTVTRWNTRHPAFIAERSARRLDRVREHNASVRSMVGRAVAVVTSRLDEGDLGAALAVLRLVGHQLNLPESGERTDPEEVYNALVDAETQARYRDPLTGLLADLNGEGHALAKARSEAEAALLADAT